MEFWATKIALALAYVIIGLIAAWILPAIVGAMVVSAADARTSSGLTPRRRDTLRKLAEHLTIIIVVAVCLILVLSLFVNSAGLLTFLGLSSAAFGLGARPLVQDYISGVIFIFEDQYNVGEKIEIFGVEGTVIDVNLRTTILRSPSGELYIVPNGEVRVVRNFGRGEFSLASIRVSVRASQLQHTLALLEELAPKLPVEIPELIEPPRILSEEGALGENVLITIFARAQFTHGVEARRKLLQVVHTALSEAHIEISTS